MRRAAHRMSFQVHFPSNHRPTLSFIIITMTISLLNPDRVSKSLSSSILSRAGRTYQRAGTYVVPDSFFAIPEPYPRSPEHKWSRQSPGGPRRMIR